MIAKLSGLLDSIRDGQAIIDVGGVGYLVFCSSRTLGLMPARGQSVSLQIETHVREDHIHLYGFGSDAERDWFRTLTTVQGVGAKVALSILGTLAPLELAQAIVAGDRATVSRADGVGPKLAQRIVIELKDKAAMVGLRSGAQSEAPMAAVAGIAIEGELADAVSIKPRVADGLLSNFHHCVDR